MTEMNKTVQRALVILNQIGKEGSVGVRELSKLTTISLPATERVLNTLKAYNYVERDETGKFILGRELFYLGKMVESRIGVRQIILKELEILVQNIDETVHLVKKLDKHLMFIESVKSRHPLQHSPKIGELYILPQGATGKMFLASLKEAEIKDILDYYNIEYTKTISELASIKNKGFAVSHGERFEGVSGFGVPIISTNGKVNFVLAVSIPSFRFDESKIDYIIEEVKKTINKISELTEEI